MTDFQAKQIRELRLRGAGYKSIASAVGLSRDTVRNYCKSHGLDGYASALVLNVKEQMESGTACLCCGKELIQPSTGRKRKFCSEKCRREWWRLTRKPSHGRKAHTMKPPAFTVGELSGHMEIRTAGTVPMNVM